MVLPAWRYAESVVDVLLDLSEQRHDAIVGDKESWLQFKVTFDRLDRKLRMVENRHLRSPLLDLVVRHVAKRLAQPERGEARDARS